MTHSSSGPSIVKENIVDALSRIASWIMTQLATYMLNPMVGSALSLSFISIFALRKLKKAYEIRKKENFLEYVKNEIIELEMKIEGVEKKISLLKQAYKDVKEEHKRISFEEQLRTEMNRLKELLDTKYYFETIMRSIQIIEPLRHIYGDKVDEIYSKVIDLANKASEGKVTDKDVKEVINKLGYLMDNTPDFSQTLLEVAEEKLK